MLIFSDVGEMREIAVGAHDRQGLVGAKAVERRLKLPPRADFVVAMKTDRGLTDLLDQLIDLLALLFAHGVAKDSAEQANVVAERQILVGVVLGGTRHAVNMGGNGHLWPPLAKVSPDAALREAPVQGRKIGSYGGNLRVSEAACRARRASASRAPSAALSLSSHS
jgi:hypothetical protein